MISKQKIAASQQQIRENIIANNATTNHRTQAINRKRPYETLEEEQAARQAILAEQIKTLRRLLPSLLMKFSRILDPRRPKSIKHQLVVLMIFGLFAFVFRLSSRREMNRELTGATVSTHLRKLFPELDSIDGAQKLFREGLLHDSHLLQRKVGNEDNKKDQQYVYALEANITLKNGLSIPLLTEYLSMENNQLLNHVSKQDSELAAFERLVERLKQHFSRQKFIVFMDALYATQDVMGVLHQNKWEYVIQFSKNKLKHFVKRLNKKRHEKITIPGQPYYRARRQEFYWINHINYGYHWELDINLVACLERYREVNKTTGKIEVKYSEHCWISSMPISINNAHELLNLGARKKEAIEDSINTEKNRGYHYKHLFSHNWNAMKGFHLLMRLGHAINALSQFTKKLKKYIKDNGVNATLKFIKETLFGPWLSLEWFETQHQKIPQLRFQME